MLALSARRRGFTLIELLVVIAIISILVAILMPVIGSVQEKARQSRCSANLLQITAALRSYKQDYGRYPFRPYYDTGSSEYRGGVSALYPDYLSSKAALMCPNDAANLRGQASIPDNYSTYNGLIAGLVSGTSHTGAAFWQFALQSDITQAGDGTNYDTVTYNFGGYNNNGWDQSRWDSATSRWVSAYGAGGGAVPAWLSAEGKRWRHYPRLMNNRAPDNTMVTRCVAHQKWYDKNALTPGSEEPNKWRDPTVRLGGDAETVDYQPWTVDVSGGASQWRIQK